MTLPAEPKIAFLASSAPEAQSALGELTSTHAHHQPEDADVICALGGDGFMLQSLHQHARQRIAGVRHEARRRRIPDEPVSRRGPA